MKTRTGIGFAMLAFTGGVLVGAGPARVGGVISLVSAEVRTHPSGKARVKVLSMADARAFVGVLELDAGGKVPLHKDTSDEFVYFLEGGGQIWIDGKAHTVGVGDLVTMPGGAEVRFEGDSSGPTKVLQVFSPAESAAKYDSWTGGP
jgi:quercetin dioxygenase-like cupin family protein